MAEPRRDSPLRDDLTQHPLNQSGAGKGLKRPRERLVENDDDVPDLAEYLSSFDMTKKQQIAVCRTYANHLAAAIRAVKEDE